MAVTGGNISVSNCVVASGKAYNTDDVGQVIHIVPLGYDCVRVSIHDPLDDNAPLPIPHSKMTTVSYVVGAFIAWPKKLITLDTQV